MIFKDHTDTTPTRWPASLSPARGLVVAEEGLAVYGATSEMIENARPSARDHRSAPLVIGQHQAKARRR